MPLICNKGGSARKHGDLLHVECCQTDFCNTGAFPTLKTMTDSNGENYAMKLTLSILGPIVGIVAIAGGILFCVLARRTRRKRPLAPRRNKLLIDAEMEPSMLQCTANLQNSTTSYHPHELRATAAGDSTLKVCSNPVKTHDESILVLFGLVERFFMKLFNRQEYLDGRSLTSGSGSGLPLLVQRTLAKQVALVECLDSGGSGFGGEVWRGVWHGESVAVKIYFSRDEAAWARETEVYSQLLPSRHDNILGYVGSDMTSRASCTQLWLVSHYHPLGSLHEHLSCSPHPLSHHQTLNICLGIVNGLLYLHTEIHGTKGKPAMAHRNLRSKSILVKNNGSCVISDFAIAATQDRLSIDRIDLRLGSKRYMAPEVLEQT